MRTIKFGLFTVFFLLAMAVSATNTQAQGGYIDPHYPMDGLVQGNLDIVHRYGRAAERELLGYGILEELILRGRRARNRDYDHRDYHRGRSRDYECDRDECYEDDSRSRGRGRSQRRGRSEYESSEEYYYERREERYQSSSSRKVIYYKEITITNPHSCYVEVWVNGRQLSYSNGRTLLGPRQSTRIEVPADRSYEVEFVLIR